MRRRAGFIVSWSEEAALSKLRERAPWEETSGKCKGPEVGNYLECSRSGKEGHEAGAEGGRGSIVGIWA